jgi:hypothetical protein
VDQQALSAALATAIPGKLADDLGEQFVAIRRDVATATLGRASPGKFVETLVQGLQALENGGKYEAQPNVDSYLKALESRPSTLPDGLRICAARLGRAMYCLRSKRNIVHKADIDPAVYDLRLLYAGAQWILAEILALASGISGEEAARLVAEVQLPVGELVETIGDRKIVQAEMTVRNEVLVLLMSYHPTPIDPVELIRSMDRRSASSVRNTITDLWKEKLLHRDASRKIVLTERGLRAAIEIAQSHLGS